MQYIIGIVIGVLVVKYWTDIQPHVVNWLEYILTLIKQRDKKMQQYNKFEESVLAKFSDVSVRQLEVLEECFRTGKSVKDAVKALKKVA